ncbi:MAG: hypothetical protein JW795_22415 [Chitinivibrionales bacterium]|nr:hypothetical protein [Chitinivibrionales bacterium]
MKSYAQYMFILCLLLITTVWSDGSIIQIGAANYTAKELGEIMKQNSFQLPEQAVEKLRTEAFFFSINTTEEKLYEKIFAKKIKDEKLLEKSAEKTQQSQMANSRLYIFRALLESLVPKTVPVKYLDIQQYWNLVTETESYKIRKEHGKVPVATDLLYTAAELSVDNVQTLALRGNAVFLSGNDFNTYINDNYSDIKFLGQRTRPLATVQNEMLSKIVAEKNVIELVKIKANDFSSDEIERISQKYITMTALSPDMQLQDVKECDTPAKMVNEVFKRGKEREKEALGKINSLLKGTENKSSLSKHVAQTIGLAKILLVKKQIAAALTSNEVYDWMKKTKFKASFEDAEHILGNKKYLDYLDQELKNSGISIVTIK